MATKYIVDNVSGQTITGDITINGNLDVTGTLTEKFLTYKALLTQTQPINGTQISDFDNKLIIGERYEIINYTGGYVDGLNSAGGGTNYPDGVNTYTTTGGNGSGLQLGVEFESGLVIGISIVDSGNNYLVDDEVTLVGGDNNAIFQITSVVGDDFSNIAAVISGTINQTGCIFEATGFIPTEWTNGTELNSYGDFVVTELENNLGFPVSWTEIVNGLYIAVNDNGFFPNTFPRESTITSVNQNGGYFVLSPSLILQSQSTTFSDPDDSVLLTIFDFDTNDYSSGFLFYTPVEIKILNTPPQT